MPSQQVDEQLVQHLYGTAVESGDWLPALERFCQLLGSCEAGFSVSRGGPNLSMVETTGRVLTREVTDRYVEHFGRFDPKLKILARKTPGYLFNDVRHFDQQFLNRDFFYQEYSLRLGTRHTLDMLAERCTGREVYLAVMRRSRAGPYEPKSEILFRQSSTHFVRALALKEKMDCLRRAGDTLDGLDFGVVVVDSFHRVTLLNRVADNRLAEEGELRVSRGILTVRSSDVDRRLNALVDSALAGHAEGGTFKVEGSIDGPLTVRVAPLPAGSRIAAPRGPAALIIIGDTKRQPRHADLSDLYNLTEAESRLALAIAEGRTLASIAARHGVKYSTVRSQLLSVMQKMGVHRQADVARVLASI